MRHEDDGPADGQRRHERRAQADSADRFKPAEQTRCGLGAPPGRQLLRVRRQLGAVEHSGPRRQGEIAGPGIARSDEAVAVPEDLGVGVHHARRQHERRSDGRLQRGAQADMHHLRAAGLGAVQRVRSRHHHVGVAQLGVGRAEQDAGTHEPCGHGPHRHLPVQRQEQCDGAPRGEVEVVLEQVGGLGDPVLERRQGQFDPLAGGIVIEREERSGRLRGEGGAQQQRGGGRSGHGRTVASRSVHAQQRTGDGPLVAALVTVVFALHALVGLLAFRAFRIGSWDLLLFDDSVRAYAHLQAPIEPALGVHIEVGPHLNALGDHFSPILALLAPLYWIWADPRMLVLAQAALIAGSVVPAFVIARRVLGRAAAYGVAVATGLAWPLQEASAVGFHEVLFVVPLLLCALERLQARRFGQSIALACALLLVKEDMGFVVAMFGVLVALRWRARAGLLVFAGGVAAALVASYVVVPAFYGHGSPDGDYYKAFFDAAPNPVAMVQLAAEPWQKWQTMLWLLVPFALLSLASPVALLALPQLGERAISSNPNHWGVQQHYNAILVPVIVVAAVEGAARLPHQWRTPWAWAAALVAVVLCGSFPMRTLAESSTWHTDAREQHAQAAVDAVPHGVTVEADNEIGPHLARHDEVWLLDKTPRGADWVVIDTAASSFPIDSLGAQRERVDILQQRGYAVTLANADYVVLRRGA